MGISTNAILAFGFDLGEELPESLLGDSEYFDFEEWFASNKFSEAEPPHGDYDRDWPDYWRRKREAIAALPYDVISHCSGDYPMYFLAARGTDLTASRGYPAKVVMPEISSDAIEAMRQFCTEAGIEWKEPDWHIFSMWK